MEWNETVSSITLGGEAGKDVVVVLFAYWGDALVALGKDEIHELGGNNRSLKVITSTGFITFAHHTSQRFGERHDGSGNGMVLWHGGYVERSRVLKVGTFGGALMATVVCPSLKIFNGFLVQQVSSSPDKHFVFALPAIGALVGAFETIQLKLSQEGFEFRLVEGSLEDCDDFLFVLFVLTSIGVDFEGLAVGHP